MKRLLIAVCAIFLLAPQAMAAATDDAQAKALAWLSLIDQQKYDESWSQASVTFRSHITEATWADAVSKVRTPLGVLKSRAPLSATTATSLPGAPDGQYAIVKFQSSFANKASGVESVTLILESGQWAPAGYFIK